MEDGLKVVLSADVSQFEQAFTKAAQTTKQQINVINQSLATTGKVAQEAAKTWQQFVGERMSAAMKQFGGHGAAIRAIAAEWAVYKQSVQQAGTAGKGVEQTAQAVSKVAAALNGMKAVSLPSTEGLVNGLNKAESALKRFEAGQSYLRETNAAIKQLIASTQGLGNVQEINTLLVALKQLQQQKQALNATGLDIKPNVDVAKTLKDIATIKGLIASEQFTFNLSADPTPLLATMKQATQGTQAAVQEINGLLSAVDFAPPSTAALIQGLNQAEAAVKKFSTGSASVEDLNNAILQLTRSKEGLSNTGAIDKLITRLSALQTEAAKVQAIGVNSNPTVNISDTLRDIEKIKGLIGGQKFDFTLTANSKGLTNAMQGAVQATDAAAEAIEGSLADAGGSFDQMTQRAQRAVTDYVQALGRLNSVPTAVKTTVQAPDMTPVIQAVQLVKSEVEKASVAALPKLTLTADTSKFNQSILSTKAITEETWAAIRQTFTGVDKAIQDAAEKARLSVQQLVQNFNALKGAGPDAVVMQVKPPNYAPVIQAARTAKRNIDQVFVSPLPAIRAPQFTNTGIPEFRKQLHDVNGVGMQFNQLLREMPNFAIDARIGVMSLSNNLPYFVDAIQNARKGGQGFGAIMSAIGSSMFSVGGIAMIAVTAFTAFAGSMRKSKEETKDAKQKMEEYTEQLDVLSRARLKGEQNGAKELVNLKLLYSATQNHSLALADRKKAVDALQEQYPNYFKNLKDEAILAGNAKTAYDDLTQAILRKARAESAQEELKELASQERTLRSQRKAAGQEVFDSAEKLRRVEAATNANRAGAAQSAIASSAILKTQLKDQSAYNNALSKAGQLSGQLNKNLSNQQKLIKEIASYGVDAITVDPAKGLKTPEVTKRKFEFLDEWLDFNPNAANISQEQKQKLVEVINRYSDQFGQILEGANFRVQGTNQDQQIEAARAWWAKFQEGFVRLAPRSLNVDFSQIPVVPDMPAVPDVQMPITLNFTPEQIRENAVQDAINDVVNKWRKQFADAELKFPTVDTSQIIDPKALDKVYSNMRDFANRTREILSSAATEAVSGFAEGIGNALAGGNINEAFGNVLSVLGSALQQMGKELIMTSSIVEAFKKALNGLMGPQGTAIGFAVGASMVAIGSMMKASANKLPKFDQGGVVFGPTLGLMGEYAGASSNPEVIAPLSKLKDIIGNAAGPSMLTVNGSWEVAGDKLRLVLDRSSRKNFKFS